MASREELLELIEAAEPDEGGVPVLTTDLAKLTAADLSDGVLVEPFTKLEERERIPAIEGELGRASEGSVSVFVNYRWWRKVWFEALGLVEYLSLVRRTVDARSRTQGDVETLDFGEDDEHVWLEFEVRSAADRCDVALEYAQRVETELREVAEAATAGVETTIANAARRVDGWGTQPLERLVDVMREGTSHQKGLRLEELTSRLFAEVPGFSASGRVLTETEEIDFTVQNASERPIWRRESALLIGECKNWSTVCGRAEFSTFKDKMRGRVGRVSCGFLVSWNGFAETIEKQMLRGSEGDLLVVPISGEDLRAAVREDDFPARLERLHQTAVLL